MLSQNVKEEASKYPILLENFVLIKLKLIHKEFANLFEIP